MKEKFIPILLTALVLANIMDGDFKNPGLLDWIKFVLLAICLVMSISDTIRRSKNK